MDKIDLLNMTGVIRLGANHSIVTGHKPGIIEPDKLGEILKNESNSEVEKFGFWEVATPNYATYYPDVTENDLKPQENDFIEPVFRLLSKTIVSKGRPIDFSHKDVLRKSMPLLLGQTVNIDHEVAIGNAIGAVSQVYWQESYKTKSGKVIPAGINGVLKIDGKSNPRIARGILMEPPSIHSNSVTVRFKWEPSHKFEDINEFYNKLGTYDKDGNLIRCLVTDILGYFETSLVSQGADSYAKKVGSDGKIIDHPLAYAQFSFSSKGKDSFIECGDIIDYKTFSVERLSIQKEDETIPKNHNNNKSKINTESKMEHLKKLNTELSLGLEEENLTVEDVIAGIKAQLSKKGNEETPEVLGKLTAKVEKLKSKLTKTKTATDKIIEEFRNEASRLYKLAKGDTFSEAFLNNINSTSDLDTLKGYIEEYKNTVEETFTAVCKSCGSKEVTRLSSQPNTEGEDGGDGKQEKSNTEVLNKFKNKKRKSIVLAASKIQE